MSFWWKGVEVSGLAIGRPAVVRRPISAGLWQVTQRSEAAPVNGAWQAKQSVSSLAVAGNQLARPDHQVRIDESQNRQHDQVGGQDDLDDAAHIQPQNRKMLMMWPSDSTAKTMKIGICTLRHLVMASSVTASQNTACSTSAFDRPRNW